MEGFKRASSAPDAENVAFRVLRTLGSGGNEARLECKGTREGRIAQLLNTKAKGLLDLLHVLPPGHPR